MMQKYDNSTGHIIVDFDGKRMLVDTGVARTYYDEHEGVHIDDLSRMLGQPLDGVLGMDSFRGRVLSITRNTIHLNGAPPDHEGVPLIYIAGVPCVDIKINEIPCRAAIKTGSSLSYISEALILKDRFTRSVKDMHPCHGAFRVNMFVNYFSIGNKSFFADAGELPGEFALLSSTGIDAIIGTDLLERFGLVLDFSESRLYLVSN